jgi:hypothetical protein
MQLLACACCRLIWDQIEPQALRHTIETVELHADGLIPATALMDATRAATAIITERFSAQTISTGTSSNAANLPSAAALLAVQSVIGTPVDDAFRRTLDWVSTCVFRTEGVGRNKSIRDKLNHQFCDLFREIVGNPFLERTTIPAWMPTHAVQLAFGVTRVSDTARSLAERIRDEQAFHRLPFLADAIEEAGCTDDPLLLHLREPEKLHCRGCWALDWILGMN